MPETDDVKCFLNDISTKIKLLSSQKTTFKVKRNYAIAVFISKSDSATFYLTSLFFSNAKETTISYRSAAD